MHTFHPREKEETVEPAKLDNSLAADGRVLDLVRTKPGRPAGGFARLSIIAPSGLASILHETLACRYLITCHHLKGEKGVQGTEAAGVREKW